MQDSTARKVTVIDDNTFTVVDLGEQTIQWPYQDHGLTPEGWSENFGKTCSWTVDLDSGRQVKYTVSGCKSSKFGKAYITTGYKQFKVVKTIIITGSDLCSTIKIL